MVQTVGMNMYGMLTVICNVHQEKRVCVADSQLRPQMCSTVCALSYVVSV